MHEGRRHGQGRRLQGARRIEQRLRRARDLCGWPQRVYRVSPKTSGLTKPRPCRIAARLRLSRRFRRSRLATTRRGALTALRALLHRRRGAAARERRRRAFRAPPTASPTSPASGPVPASRHTGKDTDNATVRRYTEANMAPIKPGGEGAAQPAVRGNVRIDDPTAVCLPNGLTRQIPSPYAQQWIQTPDAARDPVPVHAFLPRDSDWRAEPAARGRHRADVHGRFDRLVGRRHAGHRHDRTERVAARCLPPGGRQLALAQRPDARGGTNPFHRATNASYDVTIDDPAIFGTVDREMGDAAEADVEDPRVHLRRQRSVPRGECTEADVQKSATN